MAPQHDEITKRLEDGLVVAWDSTRVDPAKRNAIRTVSRQQAAELGRIIAIDVTVTTSAAGHSTDISE